MSILSLSKQTRVALKTLGEMIRVARSERGFSQSNLAQRLNVSRYSIMALEKGNPKVAIGIAFEAAVILGISLLAEDLQSFKKLEATVSRFNALLPKSVGRKHRAPDDNF